VVLDEVLAGCRPTYLKMDIEGAELEALAGARAVIGQALPVLAIAVYHVQDHLWRVPLWIRALGPQYQLYLRPHDPTMDLFCYAVPGQRLLNPVGPAS
jgi:hypothetical protein